MRILIWILIGYAIYTLFRNRGRKELPGEERPAAAETHKDPVCGVYVAADDAVVGTLEGERIYFCSLECLEKYREQVTHKG